MIQNNAGAAAARAAAEAARKAAEEAAKRAAEQAKKAAEAAQKQAAQQAKQESKQAAQELGSKDHAEAAKDTGGLFGFVDQAAGKLEDAAKAQQIEKISPAEAKQSYAKIQDDLKRAKTPEDVAAASKKAAELQGRAMVSGGEDGLHKDLAKDIEHLRNKTDAANKSVQKLDQLSKAMHDPHQRAAATAELLANKGEFDSALQGLHGLKDAPVMESAKKDVKRVLEMATPEALGKQLEADPNLAGYPPTMTKNLAMLQGAGNPALQAGIDAAAGQLLNRPGGVDLASVRANPDLGKILSGLQASPDPALKAKLGEQVKAWAGQSIDDNLDGAVGEDETKDAMGKFQTDMIDLAKQTGLGETIQTAAPAAADEKKDAIQDHAEDNGGGIGGFLKDVGDVAGDVVGGIGDFLKEGLDKLGDVAGGAISLAGKINPVSLTLDVAAKGLDTVGLDGAADAVNKVDDTMEAAYDRVGKEANGFADGVGDAAKGMTDGAAMFIKDPIGTAKAMGHLVTHPKELGGIAKTMWNEAKKGGIGHAFGYIGGNVAPMLLSGGASSATMVGKVGELAQASRFGTVVKAGGMLEKGADMAGRGLGAMNAINTFRPAKAIEALRKSPEVSDQALSLLGAGKAGLDKLGAGLGKAKDVVTDPGAAAGKLADKVGDLKNGLGTARDVAKDAEISAGDKVRAARLAARNGVSDTDTAKRAAEAAKSRKEVEAAVARVRTTEGAKEVMQHLRGGDLGAAAEAAERALKAAADTKTAKAYGRVRDGQQALHDVTEFLGTKKLLRFTEQLERVTPNQRAALKQVLQLTLQDRELNDPGSTKHAQGALTEFFGDVQEDVQGESASEVTDETVARAERARYDR